MAGLTRVSASVRVDTIAWLVAVGELLALLLSCERLQIGDALVRLVVAMVMMAVQST
jgi:hypothetical protein